MHPCRCVFAVVIEFPTGILTGKNRLLDELLLPIFGLRALFELYAADFPMGHFWVVLIVFFTLAFTISECPAYLERRVTYLAAKAFEVRWESNFKRVK